MKRTASTDLRRCVDGAFRGDRAAIEQLVRAETPRLHGIAWRIVGDASLAEDVVQEVFVRILEKRSPIRRKGAAGTWLTRVTVRAAIDLVRRRTACKRREEAHAMKEAEQREEARDAVADAEVHALVAEGFGGLPVDVRAAIWLTVVEGDSIRRAADAVGLPVTTTHRRVQEGLEALRRVVGRRGSTPVLAISIEDVLRRIPAPLPPGGLAARVLARIDSPPASGGVAGASETTIVNEKGSTCMEAAIANKVGISLVFASLVLGAAIFVADPFGWRGGREAEIAAVPVALPVLPTVDEATPPSPAVEAKELTKLDKAPAVDAFGSILARAVYEDDKEPVPGVLARAFRNGSPELRTVATNEKGEALFPDVPEGSFKVYLQMGSTTFAAKSIDVEAGRESEVTLELPPGVGIDGVVVDADGMPVPGASIWLTERQNAFRGATVTDAGEDGKFRMRHVELKRFIGARASGFAPSVLRSIEGRPTSVLPIRIVLEQPGVVVEGVVVGPEGHPVKDATVKIEKEAGGLMWTPDGTEIRYAPLSARTDVEGSFGFDCVPVGDLTITVRSEGLVPLEEPMAVPEEGLFNVTITLEEGATVAGTVRTPEGDPALGTLVAIGSAGSNNAHLSGDLVSLATSVGQDGTYRIVGVRPGEFEVHADGHGKGKASAHFMAQPGEEIRWDAQLTLGLEIFGRVVDENGKPVESALVGAEGKGCIHTWIWTDRDGRFRFSSCNEVPHEVSVRLDNAGARVARADDVMPGSGEVNLVIRSGMWPSAFISGKVVDPDGRPAEHAHIIMVGLSTIYPEKDGSFRIGPLPPGRHEFDVLLGEHPRIRRRCDLAANETADLGTIQVHRGGRVKARLRKPDGTPCPCSVRIMNEAGTLDVESRCSPDGIVTSELAQPGDYSILIGWHRGLAARWIPVTIEDGQTAWADVTIYEGAERVFRLSSPEKPSEPTRVIFREASGTKVFDCPFWPDSGWKPSADGLGFIRDFRVSFAPGTDYVAEAFVQDRSARASFGISDLADKADPIVLDLR